MQEKMLFVVNPVAGKMRGQGLDASKLFPDSQIKVYSTVDGDSTEKYVESHAAEYDLVVCAGGDGTLNHVINGVMRLENRPPIGYLPCGTTNDFAASLGIPKEPHKAAELIRKKNVFHIDIGAFSDRFFTYVASFGAFTESSYKAPQENKNKLGHMAYLFEAVRDLPRIHPCKVQIETEDAVHEGAYIFGAISNSTSLGKIVRLSPKSVLYNDGLFEVMLISMPNTVLELQDIVFSLMRRQYDASPNITFIKARHITVKAETPFPWSLDGEFAMGAKTVEIQNIQDAIALYLP